MFFIHHMAIVLSVFPSSSGHCLSVLLQFTDSGNAFGNLCYLFISRRSSKIDDLLLNQIITRNPTYVVMY